MDFEKIFQKEFAKTKHVVQKWSKMLKERKQSMHICTCIFALVCVGINHQKGGRLKGK
jgi:hypothetical protein